MTNNHALAFGAAVFDCDGTLVDTDHCWGLAYKHLVGELILDGLMQQVAGASVVIAAERREAHYKRPFNPDAIKRGLMEAAGDGPLPPLEGVAELLSFL
jgi:beta-phosphoglucomutase-like phosphatase (HAD superfamily)